MESRYFLASELRNIDNSVIRLACSLHLKILFIIVKNINSKFTISQISSILNKNEDDIKDAIEFWENFGIIKSETSERDEDNKNKNEILEKSNLSYISKRIKSKDDISVMLGKIEAILGRPLSGVDISVFTNLKDFEGLPSSVIIILVQYCVKMGKNYTRYIEKVGLSWVQEGINSVKSAKEKIKTTNKVILLWKRFSKIIGISNRLPTTKEKEIIKRWFIDWGYDFSIIKEAYERCINATGEYKLNYIDGIMKRWKNSNIFSIDDIEKFSMRKFEYNPTYDISKYENLENKNCIPRNI